ncbi:MAG: RnfH family protein [Pseudomonadales bacterium]|nr:RnfH family protein [Pseudomonadales bacterium]
METDADKPLPMIDVEVAYATPQKQSIIALQVEEGTTAYEAVVASGITDEFPDLDVTSSPMGIFSEPLDGKKRPLPAEYVLQARDRVEIYRPLLIDPKQARLDRAAKKK